MESREKIILVLRRGFAVDPPLSDIELTLLIVSGMDLERMGPDMCKVLPP